MEQIDITKAVSTTFQLEVPQDVSLDSLRERLAAAIDHLIVHDFPRLVHILYTLDISEKIVRQQVNGTQANAAELVAGLVIERLVLREQTRQQSKQDHDPGIPDDEKW
ncbi:MAG TPA: hypothetical protein VGC95_01055 [Chitinophagaceae bacterium]